MKISPSRLRQLAAMIERGSNHLDECYEERRAIWGALRAKGYAAKELAQISGVTPMIVSRALRKSTEEGLP